MKKETLKDNHGFLYTTIFVEFAEIGASELNNDTLIAPLIQHIKITKNGDVSFEDWEVPIYD